MKREEDVGGANLSAFSCEVKQVQSPGPGLFLLPAEHVSVEGGTGSETASSKHGSDDVGSSLQNILTETRVTGGAEEERNRKYTSVSLAM